METVDLPELVESLGSGDDGERKKAAFRLQSLIGDPSFSDSFISAGGLPKLQYLALNTTGNTLAYSLACCSNLLDLDQGWDLVDQELIERLVQLIVGHPLVNILRGAMSILAAIVAHPASSTDPHHFGFHAIQPALSFNPTFLEMLVSRLSSADHALCANALQLINALMRDAMTNDEDNEWPKFINKLQDLGVIKAVYSLMQSSGLQDLAHPLLDFQSLTKVLLRKWRDMPISTDKPEHRRVLRAIFLTGAEERRHNKDIEVRPDSSGSEPRHWRRLGFITENPAVEFDDVGFLGMMDLQDFTRKSEDGFRNLLLEQASVPLEQRCPIAKASLAVTSILFDHFEVDRSDAEDQQRYVTLEARSNYDKVFKPLLLQWSRLHTGGLQAFFRLWATTGSESEDFNKIEELVRILIEHVVGLASRTVDIQEVEHQIANYELRKLRELQMELLELTHEDAWGQHLRQIKDDLNHEALQFIREQRIRCLLQGAWFPNLSPNPASATGISPFPTLDKTPAWRFARLSHNRRFLHYGDFDERSLKGAPDPSLDALDYRIDLNSVTSVVSNMVPTDNEELTDDEHNEQLAPNGGVGRGLRPPSAGVTRPGSNYSQQKPSPLHSGPVPIITPSSAQKPTLKARPTNTTITVHGYASANTTTPLSPNPGDDKDRANAHSRNVSLQPATLLKRHIRRDRDKESKDASHGRQVSAATPAAGEPEQPLLSLHPQTTTTASEWLDGLLLLLNQAPITAETNKLVSFIAKYGLRIRLLNVRFEEGGVVGGGDGDNGHQADGGHPAPTTGNSFGYGHGLGSWPAREVVLPSREGVDDEFFYEVGGV